MYPEGQAILVVIEEAGCREQIAKILGAEGFPVTRAAEGLAALRALTDRRFALVVAGTCLPGSLDGKTTVRQARARQPWLRALYIEDRRANGNTQHQRGNLDCDEMIVAPFECHELIGCTFELLHRQAFEAGDLARRARTQLRAS